MPFNCNLISQMQFLHKSQTKEKAAIQHNTQLQHIAKPTKSINMLQPAYLKHLRNSTK